MNIELYLEDLENRVSRGVGRREERPAFAEVAPDPRRANEPDESRLGRDRCLEMGIVTGGGFANQSL